MVARAQSSAAGVLALLSEPDAAFKQHALAALLPLVPQFWAEISEHIAPMHVFLSSLFHSFYNYILHSESLYESDQLPKPARDLAALLASKVYYYLGEYDEALSFALGAGSAFEAEARDYNSGEYVETVICTFLSTTLHRRANKHALSPSQSHRQIHPPALGRGNGNQDRSSVTVHHRVHIPALHRRRRVQTGAFHSCPRPISRFSLSSLQAIGIALESRRLDVISRIYNLIHDVSLLSYAMEAVLDTGFSLLYRDQVLNFLLPLFPSPSSKTKSSHIHSLARLLVTLNNPSLTVPLLTSLVPKESLLAYQFAFDLAEGGTRDFLEGVRKHLPEGTEVGFPCPHGSSSFVTDRGKQETKDIFDKLRNILGGQESVKLYLEFLKRSNKVDMLILKNSKVTIHWTRHTCNSFHSGVTRTSIINIPYSPHTAECVHACRNNLGRIPTGKPRMARYGYQLGKILGHCRPRSYP